MLANHVFWRFMLFYIHLLLLLQPLVPWLSIVTFSNDAKPPPKWIWCITNPTPARWVTPPWNIYSGKICPRLRGLPGLADRATRLSGSPHLSGKRDQIKMREYISRLPHLPGVTHLHVNRPLASIWSYLFTNSNENKTCLLGPVYREVGEPRLVR